jgi:two-component system, OmpR family, response regulator
MGSLDQRARVKAFPVRFPTQGPLKNERNDPCVSRPQRGMVESRDYFMEDALQQPLLRDKKILIVDDEIDCLQLTKLILEIHGARVFAAGSVAEALELYVLHQPDIVLTDVCMPDETGLSLLHRIQLLAEAAGRKTPAIAMSAVARPEERHELKVAGFNEFLAKPYLPENLIGAVHRVLNS